MSIALSLLKLRTVQGSFKQYTVDADFQGGTLINVNHNIHNQLQLDSSSKPFNFIWVARGTVVKVDTLSGAILGEYLFGPNNAGWGNPSGIAVDTDGSVWLANSNNIGPHGCGTIVHIGLNENYQCEDRNSDSVIQTSTGIGDIKPWANDIGPRGISTAHDECIVHYTEVNSQGTSHLSIDKDNNVWVSGSLYKAFDKVKGGRWDTPGSGGLILPYSYLSVGYGGNVGVMDPNGFIWSAGPLLRWDTSKPLSGTYGDPSGSSIGPLAPGKNWAGQSNGSDGLCIDSRGNVWITDFFSSDIMKYSFDDTFLGSFPHGNSNAQGCVVDLNDHVSVAHSQLWNTVGHLDNNGFYLGTVMVGLGPTGVAVDRAGNVWSTNTNDDTITRIDPNLNSGVGGVDSTVNLGGGCYPYNYGDMTGSTNIAPPNS
jgi:streptogramin lyase